MPVPGEVPGDVPDVDDVEFSFSCWRRILAGGNAGEMMRGSTGLARRSVPADKPLQGDVEERRQPRQVKVVRLDIDIDTGSGQRWWMTVTRQRN